MASPFSFILDLLDPVHQGPYAYMLAELFRSCGIVPKTIGNAPKTIGNAPLFSLHVTCQPLVS